jgi:hypothetical protein
VIRIIAAMISVILFAVAIAWLGPHCGDPWNNRNHSGITPWGYHSDIVLSGQLIAGCPPKR